MTGIAVAWLGLLFGIAGIGGILAILLRMIRSATGGLR